jgi:hypothetical protein
MERTSDSIPPDIATRATRPPGGSRSRSRASISKEVHRQIPIEISRPLGFTTPAKKSTDGVAATAMPASRRRDLDQVTTAITAKARKMALKAALARRMR